MGLVFFIGQVLPYIAVVLFLWGIVRKLHRWVAAPPPFPLTVFPVAGSSSGRLLVFLQELLLFNSLLRHNRLLWLSSWLMHLSLGLIIVGHILGIYFLGEQFALFGMSREGSVALSHFLGTAAGLVFIAALAGLLGRRLLGAEARATSDICNYLELGLLTGIALTGMGMRWAINTPDLALIRTYIAGIISFHPRAMPAVPWFFWHFLLVNILLIYLPYSKLIHWLGGGILRIMLTEPPPVYPTAAGKPLRSAFAGSCASPRFTQPESNIPLKR